MTVTRRLVHQTKGLCFSLLCLAVCACSMTTGGLNAEEALGSGGTNSSMANSGGQNAPVSPAGAGQTAEPQIAVTGLAAVKTVFLIVMDGQSWASVQSSNSAPYIKSLLSAGGHAESYTVPTSALKSSVASYVWLEAGDNLGIENDKLPQDVHQNTTEHLTSLLNTARVSWKSYQDDMVANTCPVGAVGWYVPQHNPNVYFDDNTGNNNPADTYCIAHNRPYSELAEDLSGHNVARYNFITPGICSSMQMKCGPTRDAIRQGDNWLAQQIPMIMASDAYKAGGAIFITWGAGPQTDTPVPVGMIVLSPVAKVNYVDTTNTYTHSSMLRTMQTIFNVQPFLRDAANATDLSGFFQ